MTRRRLLLLVALAGLAAFGWWAHRRYGPWTPTPADADRVEAVYILIIDDEVGVTKVESSDRDAIRDLLRLPVSGSPGHLHACMDQVRVTFVRADGNEALWYMRPGHDPAFYEICSDDWVRVPRADFLAVMKRLGVEKIPLDAQKEAVPIP